MSKELTDKQQKFIDEYLIDLNATQAAIRAGYSEKTANRIATENLSKPVIQKAIEKAMEDRKKRTEVTQDMVINELKAIAFSNATSFVNIKNGVVLIDDTMNLDENIKKTIVGIKEGKNGIEIKMADKMQALEMLGRHLGMFKEKIELTNNTSEITKEIDDYIKEKMMSNDK